MEVLSDCDLFNFRPNALQIVRKEYGLDKPGEIEKSIKILEEWAQKQSHFVRKDFPRRYLESTLIATKGSIEKAKSQIDKLCTLKSIFPEHFRDFDWRNDFKDLTKTLTIGFLPQQTKDCYRVVMYRVNKFDKYEPNILRQYLEIAIPGANYMLFNDYSCGVMAILDCMDMNVMEMVSVLNIIDLRNLFSVIIEGYGMRLKGIYVLSNSKAIDICVKFFKQVLSKKIGDRIMVTDNVAGLFDHVPLDMLPADYGGNAKPLIELHEDYIEAISSKRVEEINRTMREFCTNENMRQAPTYNEEYLGMAGTFKCLTVD